MRHPRKGSCFDAICYCTYALGDSNRKGPALEPDSPFVVKTEPTTLEDQMATLLKSPSKSKFRDLTIKTKRTAAVFDNGVVGDSLAPSFDSYVFSFVFKKIGIFF